MDQLVLDAKNATDNMPEGHRVLFSWDLHRAMSYQNNGDFLYTRDGEIAGCETAAGFKPYLSLWWDKGIRRTRRLFSEFFESYAEAGGKLDVFVLDFEQGFSYWHLKNLAEENYPCGLDAYLDAIQQDARFAKWRDELGFGDLKSLNRWYENEHDLKWLALVWTHMAEYIDYAVYAPLKTHFPEADFSNYGYYYQSSDTELPDIAGHYRHRFINGVHVGTHQSRELYGWVDLPDQIKLGGVEYPSTPFNAFRFAINKLRGMVLSSNVPVSPWVAYKGFDRSHLRNSDYYQELIIHTLLSGVDYLLYWNPAYLDDHADENDVLLSQLIGQVNELTGNRSIVAGVNELADWGDDILITKARLEDERQLWRITANLKDDQAVNEIIEEAEPAQLRIADKVLNFDGMRILRTERSYSDKGLWLVSY